MNAAIAGCIRSGHRSAAIAACLLVLVLPGQTAEATQWIVPADLSSIQQAIDIAVDGDTVLVHPGSYVGNLDFRGKRITVRSLAGPRRTIIRGDGFGPVVTFRSGEPRESVLEGFTIRGGVASRGGGIWTAGTGTSPTIRGNWITGNRAATGAGIMVDAHSPLIVDNRIFGNTAPALVLGGGGGGIGVFGASPVIVGNRIEGNTSGRRSYGGGILLNIGAGTVVMNNVIRDNEAPGGQGGGIALINSMHGPVVQNLITGNGAGSGGGIYWLGGPAAPSILGNTVADNVAVEGSAAFADGISDFAVLENNLLVSSGPATVFGCGRRKAEMPAVAFNDIFSDGGNLFSPTCISPIGADGNVSLDPRFARDGSYRLTRRSPVVDKGSPDPLAPLERDLLGKPRIRDGDRDGTAIIDMGAFEVPGPPGKSRGR